MVNRNPNLEAAITYILPVLGGALGVIYVNVFRSDFINPVLGIGGGAILGWAVARVILKLLSKRH